MIIESCEKFFERPEAERTKSDEVTIYAGNTKITFALHDVEDLEIELRKARQPKECPVCEGSGWIREETGGGYEGWAHCACGCPPDEA